MEKPIHLPWNGPAFFSRWDVLGKNDGGFEVDNG